MEMEQRLILDKDRARSELLTLSREGLSVPTVVIRNPV